MQNVHVRSTKLISKNYHIYLIDFPKIENNVL